MTQAIADESAALRGRALRPSITDITARAFMNDRLARRLASEPLTPPEVIILLRHRDAYHRRRVLDLGVGSGRTTRYLLPFTADYLGVDLSPQMLGIARLAFPTARLREDDIRNLDGLSEGRFDFVLIAYNTIDVLDHDDRLALLSAVRRLMAPDGLLVFSTHNRSWRHCGRPPALPPFGGIADLPRYLYRLARTARSWRNHRRLAHLQRAERDYAIVTGSYDRTGLVYSVDRVTQSRQLRESGFEPLECYDIEGRRLEEADAAPDSYNLHFVSRASAGPDPLAHRRSDS